MLNPFSNRKLLKRGERAPARIVEMTQPDNGPESSNVEMLLEVNFRGVPYEVRDRWMVAGTEPISAGSQIWVAVDPENPERVAIDWRKTRADYRERTDPRRKVLSAGVPVPVSKVRDALEQANRRRLPDAESPPAEPDPPARRARSRRGSGARRARSGRGPDRGAEATRTGAGARDDQARA